MLRTFGRTGLQVSPLCLGGNVFGWTAGEVASFAVLDAYVAGGGNFIDTAESYSRWVPGNQGGESEGVIGRWLAARGRPEGLVVCTKVGPVGEGAERQGMTREHIRKACEGSLRRLGVEAIDLYLAHRDDPETPLEETLGALHELVQEGKVRHLGASNFSAGRLKEALELSRARGWHGFEALQPEYNLLDRAEFEGELAALCQEQNLGVMVYYALASGFLTGKYQEGAPLPDTARARGVQASYMNPRGWRVLAAVEETAKAHGASPSQVALAWLMAKPAVGAAIASATTADQTRELVGALKLELSADELARLDEAGR